MEIMKAEATSMQQIVREVDLTIRRKGAVNPVNVVLTGIRANFLPPPSISNFFPPPTTKFESGRSKDALDTA